MAISASDSTMNVNCYGTNNVKKAVYTIFIPIRLSRTPQCRILDILRDRSFQTKRFCIRKLMVRLSTLLFFIIRAYNTQGANSCYRFSKANFQDI